MMMLVGVALLSLAGCRAHAPPEPPPRPPVPVVQGEELTGMKLSVVFAERRGDRHVRADDVEDEVMARLRARGATVGIRLLDREGEVQLEGATEPCLVGRISREGKMISWSVRLVDARDGRIVFAHSDMETGSSPDSIAARIAELTTAALVRARVPAR